MVKYESIDYSELYSDEVFWHLVHPNDYRKEYPSPFSPISDRKRKPVEKYSTQQKIDEWKDDLKNCKDGSNERKLIEVKIRYLAQQLEKEEK